MLEKNYDEQNKYNFNIKYYLEILICEKTSELIEISKEKYLKLKSKIENINITTLKVYKKYFVSFNQDDITNITKEVSKQVFYFLKESQTYEENKIRHEKERYLDTYFMQEDIEKIPAIDNTEDKALGFIIDLELRSFLDNLLSSKQSRRVYKNKIEEIPLIKIAKEEGVDVAAIKRSVDRAILKILEKYKKN